MKIFPEILNYEYSVLTNTHAFTKDIETHITDYYIDIEINFLFCVSIGTSKQLGTIIEGESLLNDGAAIVLFNIFYNLSFKAMTGKIVILDSPSER